MRKKIFFLQVEIAVRMETSSCGNEVKAALSGVHGDNIKIYALLGIRKAKKKNPQKTLAQVVIVHG